MRDNLNDSNIELIWCEIHIQDNKKILLGLIYPPPNSNVSYFDSLSYSFHKAIPEPMPVFLMGDFKIDMLSSGNNNFKHLMAHKKLLNIVNELTNFSLVPGTY